MALRTTLEMVAPAALAMAAQQAALTASDYVPTYPDLLLVSEGRPQMPYRDGTGLVQAVQSTETGTPESFSLTGRKPS